MKKIMAELLCRGCQVSHTTVSRHLSTKLNLKSHRPDKIPRLTPAMKAKRLQFASAHQHWTAQQWKNVLFFDESTFYQLVIGKRHIRRPSGKSFDYKYTISTVESQMVCGAMSKNGVVALSFLLPGTIMNGPKYVQMLSKKLKLHMHVHQCQILFMQDRAHCHRSKVAKNFLDNKNIELLGRLGNSPNLNSIENLWTNMKNKASEKQPSSGTELVNAIKEVWVKEISKEYCQSLIKRMTRRIKAVMRSRRHTKYWEWEHFFRKWLFICIILHFMCLLID